MHSVRKKRGWLLRRLNQAYIGLITFYVLYILYLVFTTLPTLSELSLYDSKVFRRAFGCGLIVASVGSLLYFVWSVLWLVISLIKCLFSLVLSFVLFVKRWRSGLGCPSYQGYHRVLDDLIEQLLYVFYSFVACWILFVSIFLDFTGFEYDPEIMEAFVKALLENAELVWAIISAVAVAYMIANTSTVYMGVSAFIQGKSREEIVLIIAYTLVPEETIEFFEDSMEFYEAAIIKKYGHPHADSFSNYLKQVGLSVVHSNWEAINLAVRDPLNRKNKKVI